ncbi:MAG: winged helix-turn-helix domain-containing protein, partial [Acetobacteraceae bacterium]|nr:winged helix-turn-helix domain-containing protein [Acetobacteraceae bacterium]
AAPAASAPAPSLAPVTPQAPLPLPSQPRSGWRIAVTERRVYRPDGTALRLTTAEFDTLAALSARAGEVRSRDELTKIVFRRTWRPGDRAVDNAILHLRQKLASDLGEGCIVTVRQMGYVFTGFPAAA